MLLSQGMPEETKLSLQPSGHTQTERCARSKGVHNLFFFKKKKSEPDWSIKIIE